MKIRNQQGRKGSLSGLLIALCLCLSAVLLATTFRAAPNKSQSDLQRISTLAGRPTTPGITLTVTNTFDSGSGSLRQALADAHDGDTIGFASSLNGQTITLTTAQLVIQSNVTVDGPGASLLTVNRDSQAPQFRVFYVMPGHTAEVNGLTISGGRMTDNGGGILNDHSTLTIANCTISTNTILSGTTVSGGGIYNSGTMTLSGVTVSNNNASYFSGNPPGGGGISNAGTMTIIAGTVQSNVGYWYGGGISNSGMMTITDSTISGNQNSFAGHFGGSGGGIVNGGTMTIQNSTISGNTSFGGDLDGGAAGGIATGASLQIIHCSITGNRASRSGAGIYGGCTITDSVISNNQSSIQNGAGLFGDGFVINNCTIANNQALGGNGGGVSGNNSTITNSTITGNSAIRGGGLAGGGNIAHTTFSNNSASAGGGALYVTSAIELGHSILKAVSPSTNIFVSGGSLTTHGYNLSSDNAAGLLTGPGDQVNTDPLLGPLQNNGGPTSTQALLPGSPAINAGNPSFTPPPLYDQRGFGYLRVYNGRIDIGSFEVQPLPTVSPTPTATATATPTIPPPPTPTPTPCLPQLTQSSSQAITTANSASCNDGITHTDNSYWRAFDMTAYAGGGQYCVNSVSFGVEFANTIQPVTVRLYTTSNFPTGFPGSLTQIAATTINVSSVHNGSVMTPPLFVTVPAGTQQFVMELFTPNGQPGGYRFFVGSNAASETGSSYLSAPACGLTTPTTTAAMGFPNMHIVFDINGSCSCPSPTPCPVFNVTGTLGQCTTTGPSGMALSGVTLTRTSSSGDASTTTDDSGNYVMSGLSCVANTLTPSKAPRPPGSPGIDTVDVIAIQKHFLIIGSPLTGCRLTAADVNDAGGVNTVDVIATQKFFLALTSGTANVGKYQFTPASRSYSPPINNQTDQNYNAIVFGDVAPPYAGP